MMQLQFSHYY